MGGELVSPFPLVIFISSVTNGNYPKPKYGGNIMAKKYDDKKRLWSDSDLKWELKEITDEILTRIERQAIADGNIEIIHAPFKGKKIKYNEWGEANTNVETVRVFFNSDNVIDRYKSIRAVTGFDLKLATRLVNAFGYKIKSFYDFRDES